MDNLADITKLNVWGASLTDASLCERMPKLMVLSLSCNQLTRLCHFRHCINLLELYLRSNKVTDASEFQHLRPLKNLVTLWLYDNPVASLPEYRVHLLSTVPTLRKLDSDDVNVSPEDIRGALLTMDQMHIGWRMEEGLQNRDSMAKMANSSNVPSGHSEDSMRAWAMNSHMQSLNETRRPDREPRYADARDEYAPQPQLRQSIESYRQDPDQNRLEDEWRLHRSTSTITANSDGRGPFRYPEDDSTTMWEDCIGTCASTKAFDSRGHQPMSRTQLGLDTQALWRPQLRSPDSGIRQDAQAPRRQPTNVLRAAALLLRDMDPEELQQLHQVLSLEIEARG